MYNLQLDLSSKAGRTRFRIPDHSLMLSKAMTLAHPIQWLKRGVHAKEWAWLRGVCEEKGEDAEWFKNAGAKKDREGAGVVASKFRLNIESNWGIGASWILRITPTNVQSSMVLKVNEYESKYA